MKQLAVINGKNDLARRVRPAIDSYVRGLAGQVDSQIVACGLVLNGMDAIAEVDLEDGARYAWYDVFLLVRDAFAGQASHDRTDEIFRELERQLRRLQAGTDSSDLVTVERLSFAAAIGELLYEVIARRLRSRGVGPTSEVN